MIKVYDPKTKKIERWKEEDVEREIIKGIDTCNANMKHYKITMYLSLVAMLTMMAVVSYLCLMCEETYFEAVVSLITIILFLICLVAASILEEQESTRMSIFIQRLAEM